MRNLFFAWAIFGSAGMACAESVVATRAIQPKTLVSAEDVTLVAMEIPGALRDLSSAVGQEARVAIYPGRAIKAEDLARSTLIERNAIVALSVVIGGLEIVTEGRALARGGAGDMIDVMNLSSRSRLRGRIGADGMVHIDAGP